MTPAVRKTRSRLGLLTILSLAVGFGVALTWVLSTAGRAALGDLARAAPLPIAAAVGVTAGSIGLRFVRWRFLARRAGLFAPARQDLSAFLASLAGRATPAYVGEVLRCVLLRRSAGVRVRYSLPILVCERAFDAAALAALGALVANAWSWRAGLAAAALAAGLVALVAWRFGRDPRGAPEIAGPSATDVVVALALSLAAWAPAAAIPVLAARSLDTYLSLADGLRTFCNATLGGALTLMPVGVGATGSVAIVELGRSGLSESDAILATTLFRLATTGFSMAVGAIALALALASIARRNSPAVHFDEIAGDYEGYVDSDVWRLLIERRIARMQPWLDTARTGRLLDLGCGLGAYSAELTRRGYRVSGLDGAWRLLVGARDAGADVLQGDALHLPFADASFDLVYTIGVLHHLSGEAAQNAAVREITRVLAPGGVLVVHETNTRNPLFRLYMGYVFPILKSVDEGTERWIPPARWSATPSLALEHLEYFTFLPDFAPSCLLPLLEGLEGRLERSRLAPLAVHYMAVSRRPAGQALDPP